MPRKKDEEEKLKRIKAKQGIAQLPEPERELTQDELRASRPPPVDITTIEGGQSITRFGVRPPPERAIGKGVDIAPTQEELQARLALSPEEQRVQARGLFEERQQRLFDEGMETGVFKGLSLKEAQRIGKERGIEGFEGKTVETEQDKTFLDKTAELGVLPAVAAANLISKALKPLGIKIGTITKEQFAETTIGKTLGLVTVGAAATAAGYFAWTMIPSAGATATLTTAPRAALGANAIKTGMFAKLSASNLVKGLLITGAGTSFINGRIADLETSIVNQRETITLIGSAVQNGAITPQEAIIMFAELEESINETESAIHQTQNISPKAWLGKGKEVETRVQKAKQQLVVERGRLAQFIRGEDVAMQAPMQRDIF